MIVTKVRRRKAPIAGLIGVVVLIAASSASAAPWRAGEGNTRGWQLMSPQERIEHQARVRGFSDHAACQAYREQHHDLMVQRAQQRGLELPGSHWDFCDRLKPRGAPSATD